MPLLLLPVLFKSSKKQMNTKMILGGIAAGVGVYLLTRQRKRFFQLPNGQIVAESELRAFGYVPYQDFYFTAEFLNKLAKKELSAQQWEDTIKAGFSLYQTGTVVANAINAFINQQGVNSSPLLDANTNPINSGGVFDNPELIA